MLPNQQLLFPVGSTFTQLCAQTSSLSPFAVAAPANRAPSANAGANRTVEATSAAGASVTLNGSGSDPDNDTLSFAWNGPCGSASTAIATLTCPLGSNTMTLTVNDGRGGTAMATVQIVVQDSTAPALTLPANITREATGPAGAVVNYTATAQDIVSGSVAPSCTPPSGSNFSIGTTTVNCSASDAAGNSAAGSFTVTVRLSGGTTTPAPTLVRLSPASGARGQVAIVYVTGTELRDKLTLNVSGSGVQVLGLTRITSSFAIAFINVAANAPVGQRSVTISNIYGTSNALPFTVQ
jgi:hypothetical protein